MKPSRLIAIVVVLGVAAFAAIALLTEPAGPSQAAVGAPPGPGAGAADVRVAALAPGAATSVAAVPVASAPPEWPQVEVAVRPGALGLDLAAPVSDGFDALRDAMDPCFAAERAHPHRPAVSRKTPVYGPPILVFRLEAAHGHLVVADTEVETTGSASRELVECCRTAAKGYEMPVPDVEPGRRFRVKMLLQ